MKVDGINIEIVKVESLGGSPAKCTLLIPKKKARVTLAKDKFKDFDKQTRMFVILHELGHAVKNTGNEIVVDRWAFKQYAKTGLPLSGAVFALSKVLDPLNNPEHSERVKLQFQRAKMHSFLKGKINLKEFKNLTHRKNENTISN